MVAISFFISVIMMKIYGAPEGSRVTFAKMRDPDDEDNTPGWLKEANFMATNLTKLGARSISSNDFWRKRTQRN